MMVIRVLLVVAVAGLHAERRVLRWSEPIGWLVLAAAFATASGPWPDGAVIHHYPYFFADADRLGYLRALMNGAVAFLMVFYLLGLGAVAMGRLGAGADSQCSRSVSRRERG